MKFLVDQNLSPAIASQLTFEGHEAWHTRDLGLDRALDEEIFAWCRLNEAVLLTADKRLTKYLAEQHATSPSVVIFRGYLLDAARVAVDLLANLRGIADVRASQREAVFSVGPDRPTRAQLLPLISELD